ncbi:MAG: diaminopimelate decarboxylase [Candidatus Nomurabacteria bacterium]|jgi:diaminopimelate decarboxylase|nr:diaminopimelate decarboxylase [Candidatus Nomurabacteria bacterium]
MINWSKDYKQTSELLDRFGSPLYVYDQAIIARQVEKYRAAFADFPVLVRNFFAVKALPNPAILRLLVDAGMGLDCSSIPELELARMSGVCGENVIFTSNNTSDREFAAAVEAGAIINFDDINLVKRYLSSDFPLPEVAFCRYNPGDLELGENSDIIGRPSEAKYGMPHDQIAQAYKLLRDAGVKRFGLHTMLLSNETNHEFHEKIANSLFGLAAELSRELGIEFEAINLGGGFGVAYRPEQADFDIGKFASDLAEIYRSAGLMEPCAPKIYTESGRWVTADSGFLLTRVINRKDTHRSYVGVDASMANLMRPGMYSAYHHIEVLSNRSDFNPEALETIDVVGSLCENNDKFAVQRQLPVTKPGDIMVIDTVGAHGHAMGFQYNGRLRSAEVLLSPNGPRLIRRAETADDHFATLKNLQGKETNVSTN